MSEQIIKLYKQGHSAPAIAIEMGTSPYHIYKILITNHIPRRTHREKSLRYSVNESFFDDIDSEDKAYWLGFLAADGYQTGTVVGCSLSLKDKRHLMVLKETLNATHPVKVYTQTSGYKPGSKYCRLIITSPKLCAGLEKHGVVKNKTHKLEFPNLPSHLERHYIRGYFDGDGCWAKSKKSASGFTMKVCGTKQFLIAMAKAMKLSPQRVHKHKTIYCLEKSGKDVLRLMDHLYVDSYIALERKKERWSVAQSLLAEKPVENRVNCWEA